MSEFTELVESIERKAQYRTNLKGIKENTGSRNIRNLVQVGKRKVTNMINSEHPSPNPKDDESKRKLVLAEDRLNEAVKLLREVKDRANGKRRGK